MSQNQEPQRSQEVVDLLIVGAGPIGLACGIEASYRGVTALVLEKGCLVNSVFHYPPQLIFFSSPRLLELGNLPLICAGPKPTRSETLNYYRRVAEFFALDVRTHEAVDEIQADSEGLYAVRTSRARVYTARFVVLALGAYDHPNLLGISGEKLPKVSHYYKEPHPYYRKKVAVVGGQNSAVEAALDLWRHGAEVTLVHRQSTVGEAVKYWLRPDIENRIQEGSIQAFFDSKVERIEDHHVVVRRAGGEVHHLENDFVFLMTGYHTDLDFLKRLGIVFDTETHKPIFDPATMETNLPGVYIAGVAAGGKENNKLFIENTRYHAKLILQDVERKMELDTDEEV